MKEFDWNFHTDHFNTDLKRHSLRGGTVMLLAQGCKFILQVTATITLARLLTPEDYGLFSIVITVITFLNMFKDLGLATAVVSSPSINPQQSNALFWINSGLGIFLALVAAVLAPSVAVFFREPRLSGMILAMASTFVLFGFSNQHVALLIRQMRFLTIAVIQVSAIGLGTAVGIISAWYGLGYWSLVLTQIVIAAIQLPGVWIAVRWFPSLPQRVSVRSFMTIGGRLTGVSVLGYLNRNLDNLLIGWLRGARELGFYDKAYQLILLPILQINFPLGPVAISALSRLQNDPPRYRVYFSQIVLILSSLGMPLIAFLFVTAEPLTLLTLGNGWSETIPLFRALAPAAFVDTFASAINWMFISLNQTERQLRSALAISAVIVIALVIGAPWGALGIAIGFSIARVGVILPHLMYVCAHSPIRWAQVLKILARPAFASLTAAGLLALSSERILIHASLFLSVLSAGIFYSLSYGALWVLIPGGRKMLSDNLRWTRSLLENTTAKPTHAAE